MKTLSDLSVDQVRKLLSYDPATGIFAWRPRPVRTRFEKAFNTKFAGRIAGYMISTGYRQIEIFGVAYQAHRLAWLYVTGVWPECGIDHKDTDTTNNRFQNLRIATKSKNGANRRIGKNNTSGFKGVSWNAPHKKWHALIRVNGKRIYLGAFKQKSDAVAAYHAAAHQYFGEFART